MDLFSEIADERRALANLLDTLDNEQLATPSLCDAWTVRDVFAHLLMPLVTPMPTFMLAMIINRMNFDRTNVSLTARTARRDTAGIAEGLRDHAGSHFTPPGLGPRAPLTDCLVHGQDIRRPLGVTREFPEDRIRTVLEFITSGDARGIVPANRVADLTFTATDLEWSAGVGPEVIGPAQDIMMAVAGRTAALAGLVGAGVAILRDR